MPELTSEKRNELSSEIFGIPELRKFPLNDEEHVRKAIQMFHHCPLKYKKTLAKNIYYSCDKYDIKLDKSSPIYEYLPKTLQENFDFNFIIEGLEEEFYDFINEAYMNEVEAQQKVDTAIDMWRQRLHSVKTSQDKAQLSVEARAERAAVANCMKNGDMLGIIKRAQSSTSRLQTALSKTSAKLTAKAQTANSAVGEVGANVARGAVAVARVPGVAAKGLAKGLAPGVKAGITIAAGVAGAKAGGKINQGIRNMRGKSGGLGGVVSGVGSRAAGAALASAVAISSMTMSQRRSMQDVNIRKHAGKYVEFCNKLPSEVDMINVSATSGAIQPMQKQQETKNEQDPNIVRPKG